MSHFVIIKTQIRDLDALRDACAELKIGFLKDAEARGFNLLKTHGDYVIRLNGPYDIAVIIGSAPSETYQLATDWWGGHVEKEVGKEYNRLLQIYAVHKTIREAAKRRLKVTRRNEQDGNIKLILGGV